MPVGAWVERKEQDGKKLVRFFQLRRAYRTALQCLASRVAAGR